MSNELEDWIENQFEKEFSEEEIYETLLDKGYDKQTAKEEIEKVESQFNSGNNQRRDSISGVELRDDEYFVKQHLVRNKYEVYDPRDNLVLKAKQKLFKMKEEIPFTDPQGNVVFTINAQNILDIAGDYTLIDERRGNEEIISILQKDFTFFRHSWKIKDKNGNVMANVTSRSMVTDVMRSFSTIFNFLPLKYSIETPQGEKLGEIEEKFSFKDKYWVRIGNTGNIPKETLVASAIAIDALEDR